MKKQKSRKRKIAAAMILMAGTVLFSGCVSHESDSSGKLSLSEFREQLEEFAESASYAAASSEQAEEGEAAGDADGRTEETGGGGKAADGESADAAEEDSPAETGVIHNGSSVVRYQGADYYWRYNSDSKTASGLFAAFSDQADAVNEMVCRHADGTEEVLFTADGNGDFYIIGERFYLGQGGSRTMTKLYSVCLDGSDRVEYPDFYLQCADAGSGLLVGTDGKNLQVIHTEDGSRETLSDQYYSYCGTLDGYAYFSTTYGDEMQVALCRYRMDGTEDFQEVDRFTLSEDYRYESANVSVMELSLLDDTLYYSYGYYSGTAGMFQQGGINCVGFGENGAVVSRETCVEEIHAEEFLVEKEGGSPYLYYEDDDGFYGSYIGYWSDYTYANCKRKNLATGEVSESDFPLSRAGSYVYLDGGIAMIEENRAAYTTVIPEELVSGYGCLRDVEGEDTVVMIRDLERVEDDVYYTVETSVRTPEADFGWRPSYARQESVRYRLRLGEKVEERLYSY